LETLTVICVVISMYTGIRERKVARFILSQTLGLKNKYERH